MTKIYAHPEVLKALVPSMELGVNVFMRDDSDGFGPYIHQWDLSTAVPTQDQIATATTAYNDTAPIRAFKAAVEANEAAIQRELDRQAALKGYDNIKSAALRAGYAGPFQAEGTAFAQWMDACWASAYVVLGQVQAGQRAMPTPEEAVALMPELELPQ